MKHLKTKKAISFFMAMIMCLSTFIVTGTIKSSAATTGTAYFTSFPRSNDAKADYSGTWGKDAMEFMNGWSCVSSVYMNLYSMDSRSSNICYCIEPGTPVDNGDQFTQHDENYWANYPDTYNKTISASLVKVMIGRILVYGYCGPVSTEWVTQDPAGCDKLAKAYATQLLIWETIVGERDEDFNHVNPSPKHAILDGVKPANPIRSQILSHYNSIVKSVQQHTILPSFCKRSTGKATTVDLAWNGTNYSATLTDSNNVLSNYTFKSNDSNIKFKKDGNKLTIYTTVAPKSSVSITAEKSNAQRKGLIIWSDGIYKPSVGMQDMITYGTNVSDPVEGFVNVKVSTGAAKLVKTSEDGKVEGLKFTVTGSGYSKTFTTDKNGTFVADNLAPGTYTVTEQSYDIYNPQESHKVTVVAGQTATVTFNNTLRRGELSVKKTSEDGLVEGVKFHLYGTSASGLKVDQYAITNKSGIATFKDVLIGSNYTLEEIDTADRYVVPSVQKTTIEWNKVTNKSFDNVLKKGDLTVKKTSEDGFVEGIKFRLYGTSYAGIKIDEYAVTDKTGVATFKNILIGSNYILEEVNTPDKYVVPENQKTVIEWNKVTNKTFENILKKGSLTVTKTSEDGLVEGVKFHLYGISYSGIKVDEYATTDKSGKATFKDILMGTNYTLEEVNTAIRYVIPDTQNANIEWNKVTNKSVNNILKKFNVTVIKKDVEKGISQGNAKLSGAVYGVYKDGKLVDKYTTDSKGSFTTKYYVCDKDWTVKEITPSEGYLLNEKVYSIGNDPKNYTIELNKLDDLTVTEQVIKGKITIIKHCDDGSTQIETPEKGAKFEVYLKASQSYKEAKEYERDLLTCDEYGYTESKALPYGIYTVKQISGWDGNQLMKPFDVYINSDGHVYRYLINNSTFHSYVQIIKKDSTTGKTIPYSGAGFQIYDPDGKQITMQLTYPTVTTIDTFYTDSNGKLVTPKELPYGIGYSLVEVSAPYGYVLDKTPVYFDVTAEGVTDENGVDVVKVFMNNAPQMGVINIEKTGEVFSSVIENDGIYQPVYEAKGLKGAKFQITALEDVITLDGTKRYSAGDVVATIETDENGKANTPKLFLGKYSIEEIEAPYGMVLDTEKQIVELTYAGQEVSVTKEMISITNERQHLKLYLQKEMQTDETFGIGNNSEVLNVTFGIYAAEDIIAQDGTLIPKDGLIEKATCLVDGSIWFKTDLPAGSKVYIKEISTDEHYILSEDVYEYEFVNNPNQATVEYTFNDDEPIKNDLFYGTIKGVKTDKNGKLLEGTKFGLFNKDTTEFTEENAIVICVTDKNGQFIFEKVPYGDYILKEITPSEGYVLNDERINVSILDKDETCEFEVVNEKIKGVIIITKTDVVDGKPLANVGFRIRSEQGEIVAEGYTDKNGVVKFELEYGKYTYQEFSTLEGYILDEKEYPFEIKEDGVVIKAEMTNERVPEKPVPTPEIPKTGDSMRSVLIGLGCTTVAAVFSLVGVLIKRKEEEDEE